MEFGAPRWLWLLAVAPLAAMIAAWCWRRRLSAATAWATRNLWDRLLPTYRPRRLAAWNLLLAIAVAATALTLARPRWGTSERIVERRGIDVVFVLDTSLSMATNDVEPSRLWVAQTLIRQLVRELEGHRVALVQAEGDGVVMAPLTADGAVLDMLLDAVQPGSLPTPGTDLRQALERARALFSDDHGAPRLDDDGHRVLVLVSDGEDHGSDLDRISTGLRQAGLVVHALGVGTRAGKPLELPRESDDEPVRYKRDAAGHVVVSRLIEDGLRRLSQDTGGIYLRAASAAADLSPIVDDIEAMTAQGYDSEVVSTLGERFQWPAGAAILALALHLLISPFGRRVRKGSTYTRGSMFRTSVFIILAGLVTPAPAAADWPPWLERWLFNSSERTDRGIESFEEGDASAAVEPLETASRLAGERPETQYNVGAARLGAGQTDVQKLLQAAAEADGELASLARYNLGNARLAEKDFASAIEAYEQVLRQDPTFQDAKYNLELARRQLEEQQEQQQEQEQDQEQPPQEQPQPQPQPQEQSPPPPHDPQTQDTPPPDDAPQPQQNQQQRESPLPQFRDLPDMSAEEAAAILEATLNMEREQRRRDALKDAKQHRSGEKDW